MNNATWARLRAYFRPPSVRNAAELRTFVERRASFLAQKSVIGYCRLRTGSDYDKLMEEPAFAEALDRCRWTAFAHTLGDVLVAAEAFLRPGDEGARNELARVLAGFYPAILRDLQPDPRFGLGGEDCARFRARLALAALAAPAMPDRITAGTARVIFDGLPVHPRLRRHDLDIIENDLRFGMVACWQAMEETFRPASLIPDLLTVGESWSSGSQ